MRFRIVILILMVIFVTNVFGKDYTNERHGIHFTLPDHWKTVDFKDLPLEKQQRLNNRSKPFKTLSICGFRDHDGPDRTNVIIQYNKFEKQTFDSAKKYMRSEFGKKMAITSAEVYAGEAIGKEIKHYRVVKRESDFVNSSNRAYGVVHYESNGKPNLVSMIVKILLKDGVVNLDCFSMGSEAEGFVDVVNNIVDSFQYDGSMVTINETPGEIGNLSNEQTAKSIWKWVGIILAISIVLGFVKMLFVR